MPLPPGEQTGWIRLGIASTETGMLAIVAPECAGILGDDWIARYVGEDGELLPEPSAPPEHELLQFEELELVGEEDTTAVLITVAADGGYLVEGRFGDPMGDGSAELTEIRIRLWACGCECHDGQGDDAAIVCDGDCHGDCQDDDPA